MVVRSRVAWIVAVALSASPALAQEGKDPREVQARKDCLTGKVESGVRLLVELFTETKDANYIFNQARCYERNNRPTEAIASFREYLRVAKSITDEETAEVNRHIAECRTIQAEQEEHDKRDPVVPADPPQPAAGVAAEAEAAAAGGVAPAGLDLAAQPTPASGESPPVYKKWWFWTGVGAVLVAGTVTAFVLANRSGGACDGADLACMGVK